MDHTNDAIRYWKEPKMKFDKARMQQSPDYDKVKDMILLLIECRDALPAISLASAKLRNISLTLADRIDICLDPWAVPEGEKGI